MAAGRKRTAPHLRVVDSRAEKATKSKAAAAPAAADKPIVPPAGVSPEVAKRFEEIVGDMRAAGIASPTYRRLAAQIARREEDIAKMREKMDGNYCVWVTTTQEESIEKAHPMVAAIADAERHLSSLYAAACITPADISKAPLTKGNTGANPQSSQNEFIAARTR